MKTKPMVMLLTMLVRIETKIEYIIKGIDEIKAEVKGSKN